MSKKSIKLVSLNTHGLKTNISYVKYLLETYDIVFLTELWLIDEDKFVIEELCKDRNLVFFPAQQSANKKGRPAGGLAWVIKSETTILDSEIISPNISKLNILINDELLSLIGLYTPYNNNSLTNLYKQAEVVDTCEELIYSNQNKRIRTIILGDMNSDPYRGNKFDSIFTSFVCKVRAINLSILNTQSTMSTYHNSINCSRIDHILVLDGELDSYDLYCNILNDGINLLDPASSKLNNINTSDHLALELALSPKYKNKTQTDDQPIKQLRSINWKSEEVHHT